MVSTNKTQLHRGNITPDDFQRYNVALKVIHTMVKTDQLEKVQVTILQVLISNENLQRFALLGSRRMSVDRYSVLRGNEFHLQLTNYLHKIENLRQLYGQLCGQLCFLLKKEFLKS